MTDREKILEMPAGRLLDALVAEHVMQMDVVPDQLPHLPKYYLPEYDRTIFRDVPLYSSDISAAWEIVDKMDSEEWDLRIIKSEDYREVAFGGYMVLKRDVPEAICKAALLAVRGYDRPR